ncbi:MAG: cysteine desulfurase family protein [Eudoraea sp.]|uniref:cysteine desulfurase family protein n=1 Tax=Eudoraea sp. TaxID=1979955 RepID=UPI003C73475C
MPKIYFDNAATTPVRKEVITKMKDVLVNSYGNPSSTHGFGRSAKTEIEQARKTIAKYLNAQASEIIFTSGGTEADNMILRSVVKDMGVQTIITSKIEHHAVLHTAEALQKEFGIQIEFVKLDSFGNPDLKHLEKLLLADDSKKIVSLMHVNNEIGNILDIQEIAILCKANGVLLHSDTVQSIGHFKWDVQKTPIDFMVAAAHKFHGPKGVGFAFIRKNTNIEPLILGGSQERGYRAGTEPIHNIVGLKEAFVAAYDNLEEEKQYISSIKEYFIKKIKEALPEVKFNGYSGNLERSTYTLVNVCLPFSKEKSQMLLFHLDLKGIACSEGSACQSGASGGSHVLAEILSDEELQKPSVRFSFSKYNTSEEVDYVIEILKDFSRA